MKVEKAKLKNGISVYIVRYPGTELISSNVIIKTGGRYERSDQFGLSHFLEHIVFKGTKSYPDYEALITSLEDRGAIVNAWTTEEFTCYWNMMPKEYLDTSLKVLSEQVSSPLLRSKDIEKERGPILEEIKRTHDDPSLFLWKKLAQVMWPGQPISGGVLGPAKNIRKFKRSDFTSYLKKRYVGENINVCIVSSADKKIILKTIKKYFSDIPKGKANRSETIKHDQNASRLSVTYRDMKQSRIVFGYKTFPVDDKRVPAMNVLMTILGKGMSSILFKEVREERGLAYDINGAYEYFHDAGAAYIFGGLNAAKTGEAIEAIKGAIDRLKKEPLSKDRVEKAKEFMRGITLNKVDGVQNTANWLATKSALDPTRIYPEEYLKELRHVTPEDVMNVANDVFRPENESLLILGPFKDKKKFAKILKSRT